MFTRYVCDKRELSCIIPNMFEKIREPCHRCKEKIDDLVICGTTHDGREATIIVREYGFDYHGDAGTVEEIRKQRCPYE